MTPEQEQHLESVKLNFMCAVDTKYRQGQISHGGNLWRKKGLIDMAIDEAVDQVVYLLTLKDQIGAAGIELGVEVDK
jgi:hypothetical protein